MSKLDDMRAMREARYEASRSGAARSAGTAKTPLEPQTQAKPATSTKPPTQAKPQTRRRASTPEPAAQEVVPDTSPAGTCGHRAISGRTCTRDAGHAAKSHRYS